MPQSPPQPPFRVVVLLSGRGSNFEALYHATSSPESGIEIPLVVSDKAKARGLELARSFGIESVIVPRRAKEQSRAEFNRKLVDAVQPAQPNLVVLAGFMQIVDEGFLAHFPNRVINIHPSLLPQFPGLEPQAQALRAGVTESGCTVHFVTAEVDAGPTIAQARVPVRPDDTPESLAARILEAEHRVLPEVVQRFARGEIEAPE